MPFINLARRIISYDLPIKTGVSIMIAKHLVTFFLLVTANFAYGDKNLGKESNEIEVHRSPSCNCCGKWVDHLKLNNFNVKDIVSNDVQSVKDKYGVTKEVASCHTAIIKGYVVEGHVPADDINNLLKNKPEVVGLTVPGMVTGTPGMEMGGKKDAYNVLSFDKNKQTKILNSYKAE
jgi:hypothetical protein